MKKGKKAKKAKKYTSLAFSDTFTKKIMKQFDPDAAEWEREGFDCYADYLAMGDWEDEPEPELSLHKNSINTTPCCVQRGEVVDEELSIKNKRLQKLSRLAKGFAELFGVVVVGEDLYAYDDERGCYAALCHPERAIEQTLSSVQADQLSSRDFEEIVNRIRRMPYRQRSADDFNSNPFAINCRNGVVDLTPPRTTLRRSSPQDMFTYCVEARYIPRRSERSTPVFESFCETSLEGDLNKRRLLLEMIGYICGDSNAGKCALFLKGEPNSGKSVMADFICQLFGPELVSNVPLHKLSDRFNIAELFGKKVNVCGEIKAKKLTDITIFKMVTGSDRIQAEFKGQDPFTFRPRCKMLFSGNALPGTREADSTAAFANRLVVLLFNQSIPDDEQDKGLADKLWTERDSIFSAAVDAYGELAGNNFVFTLPDDSGAFLRAFKYAENSVRAFLEDQCICDPNAKVFNCNLLAAYKRYCHENGLEERPRQQLYDAVDALPGVTARRLRIGRENLRGRVGVKLRPVGGTLEQNFEFAAAEKVHSSGVQRKYGASKEHMERTYVYYPDEGARS